MKNIDIRNLAKIGVADVDVYKTDRKKIYFDDQSIFVLFFRSKNQASGSLPKTESSGEIRYDNLYTGNFGFDTYIPKLYPARQFENDYTVNTDIKTVIEEKKLNRDNFKLESKGNDKYYIPSVCITKNNNVTLYIKGYSKKKYMLPKLSFKFVLLNEAKLPIKNAATSEFRDYPDNKLNIISGKELILSGKEDFDSQITIQAVDDFDDHIGLICFYKNDKGEEFLVGQCNFVPNKKNNVKLKFIKVKVTNNGTEKYTENHSFDITGLSSFLNNNTMGQAAMNIIVPKNTIDILKLEEKYKEINSSTGVEEIKFNLADYTDVVDLKNKGDLSTVFKRNSILATKNDTSESKLQSHISKIYNLDIQNKLNTSTELNAIYEKYKNKIRKVFSKEDFLNEIRRWYLDTYIPFFLLEDITFKIYLQDGNWKWTEAFESNRIKSHKLSVLVSKFSLIHGKDSYSTYAHELAHGLSLGHIFENSTGINIQKEGLTLENVMDYYVINIDGTKLLHPKPYVFNAKQWENMKSYHTERSRNELQYYENLFDDNPKEAENLKKDCEDLLDNL
ncbi:hypothetical protein MKS83_13285 [Chryseobacterium sp. Y16C]|uniref:hypothetical protein n=1 Tax=Chryseobacterium sp. Y16C TaxID=2920939 RepID=UPI001F0AA2FE|nr:hypothetical protein [Chryseobacterium sp. Y16C]UMQ40370.1 hypothetical protein MKS83_13285 [Chryseobacterium sp. Y16C]